MRLKRVIEQGLLKIVDDWHSIKNSSGNDLDKFMELTKDEFELYVKDEDRFIEYLIERTILERKFL